MSEEVKKPKAKKSSSTTKKATSKKTPAKKSTTTKKTTTKKVAKKEVEKDLIIKTPGEEPKEEIKTEMNDYTEPAIESTDFSIEQEVPVYQAPVSVEENNMEKEEQSINEQEVKIEPIIEQPREDVYRATRIPSNEQVNTSYQYVEPTIEPVNTMVDNSYQAQTNGVSEEVHMEDNTLNQPIVDTYEPVNVEPVISIEEPVTPPVVEEVNTVLGNQPVFEENNIISDNQPVFEENNIISDNQPVIEENNAVVENQFVELEPKQEETIIQEPIVSNQTVEPVKQKSKKDVRTILLFLLFIFLFAFIMFMPQINDLLNNIKKDTGLSEIERKAKEIEQAQNGGSTTAEDGTTVKEKLSTLTCTSTTVALDDYDRTVVEIFEYNSNKEVVSSTKTITYTFTSANETYENLKTQCNENSLKYIDKSGYEVACSYNDVEVVMSDKFDLSTFSTITDGTTTIEANAKYKENISSVQTRLESLGYTCE